MKVDYQSLKDQYYPSFFTLHDLHRQILLKVLKEQFGCTVSVLCRVEIATAGGNIYYAFFEHGKQLHGDVLEEMKNSGDVQVLWVSAESDGRPAHVSPAFMRRIRELHEKNNELNEFVPVVYPETLGKALYYDKVEMETPDKFNTLGEREWWNELENRIDRN